MVPETPSPSNEHASFGSAVRSAVLVFLLMFPLTFIHLLVHEGGHALVNLFYRVPNTSIFIHPFSFSGFSRPMLDYHNVWMHLGGPTISILVALILYLIFWKRRNYSTLFILVYIAWTAFWEGLGFLDILGGGGDFYNVTRVTDLPVGLFFAIDLILFIIGIILFVTLIPLFGLRSGDLKTLWVFPAGMGLYGVVSLAAANVLAPLSPYLIQYDLVKETLTSASFRPVLMAVAGLLFAGVYVTLHRAAARKLPTGMHTAYRPLAWRDLRGPAGLALISVAIGIPIIL